MNFKDRKLPPEAASDLRKCPIDSVEPFALMIAPVYVFMRRNEKFIAVKAPLDFFTPQSLDRLRDLDLFFMPPFVDRVLPYRDLAHRSKMLLNWSPIEKGIQVPPTPYELSDAILRMTAPMWGRQFEIEPFFVTVFVNELCSLLPSEELNLAREEDFISFERAILLSAWVVFLMFFLGAGDLTYLDRVRLSVFRKITRIKESGAGVLSLDLVSDSGELLGILDDALKGEMLFRSLGLEFFQSRSERVAQKIAGRMRRLQSEGFFGGTPLDGTIYGERGFVEGGAE